MECTCGSWGVKTDGPHTLGTATHTMIGPISKNMAPFGDHN